MHTCFLLYIIQMYQCRLSILPAGDLLFQKPGIRQSGVEVFSHTLYRMGSQNIILRQFPWRKPCEFPEYPVEMPDGIKAAAGRNICNRESSGIMVQKMDRLFQPDNIQILRKSHSGNGFKKTGKIRF